MEQINVYQLPEGSDVSYGFRIVYKQLPKGTNIDEAIEFAVAQTKRLESAAANLSGREVIFGQHLIKKLKKSAEVVVQGKLGGYFANPELSK